MGIFPYLRVGDGNESDSAMFATLLADFKRQWQIDALFVADAALYTQESATNVSFALGVETRHPDCCKTLLENMPEEAFNDSVISGYRIAPCCSEYGGVRQRWSLKVKPEKMLTSNSWKNVWLNTYQKPNPNFGCCLNKNLLAQMLWLLLNGSVISCLHQLADIQVKEVKKHTERGRPSKDACPTFYYQVDALLELKETLLPSKSNELEDLFWRRMLSIPKNSAMMMLYANTRHSSLLSAVSGFSKTLYFLLQVSSSTQLSESALAMVMGLCLLVYSLGQRTLRQALERAKKLLRISWVNRLLLQPYVGCFNVLCLFIWLRLHKSSKLLTTKAGFFFGALVENIISFLN